ncbi:hypothetical protein A2468_07745 [Candidatus Falkowbacteria bacterium RIFOXYC2_FULL_46_15]|uniref:Uncharacterized protein n=1 Tax=Candidatus Falkowbacteria bacterium RIFOXYA2_FULL_47_19 TaxID=1797994 RepID=A0A1F5SNB9_9BACT|nr:MAG: hypothetical protein A2227_06845 [Candidatus Falkowbacteria bacterium RIFOXYA2_FULL_47_19]OGF34579.1 MAG: hypothetical protein A2468_07745 [Candidatus Falkowbacteria bacterium RIFOXYC2_FULL_46_15]
MNIEKNIASDQTIVPWYFGRKFWGILIGLSALPSIWLIIAGPKLSTDNIFIIIPGYFWLMAEGFVSLTLFMLNQLNAAGLTTIYYDILYCIILLLFFYLSFRKKRVNVILSIIIIIIIIISTYGSIGVMIAS